MHLKSRLRAQSNKVRDTAGPVLAEGKVASDEQVADTESVSENSKHKVLWRKRGEFRIELENQYFADPGLLAAGQLFFGAAEEPEIHSGREHPDGVGIQCEDNGRASYGSSPVHDSP